MSSTIPNYAESSLSALQEDEDDSAGEPSTHVSRRERITTSALSLSNAEKYHLLLVREELDRRRRVQAGLDPYTIGERHEL